MSEVSNSDLLSVLLSVREDIGAVKANGASLERQLTAHVATVAEAAQKTAGEIKALQLAHARQKGVLAALTAVGGALGAGVGYAVDLFSRGH